LPPEPEQKAISDVLRDIDIEIIELEARKLKAAQLKQGMMQQLLTGKIRLT
jgi:type I restriction enzyme S subunit